jgi:type VI secretion system protein ImpI
MLLALSIISSQGASLGPTAYKVFDQRGGSIGRIEGNDWVLPDAEKFVSSRHAQVRWIAGAFYLEDVSSNGTFINAPDRPVPRTQPMQLRDGDRLFIGDYEVIVQLIESAEPAAPTLEPLASGALVPPPTAAPQTQTLRVSAPPPDAPAHGLGLGTVDPLAVLGGARSETPVVRAPAAASPLPPPAAVAAAPNGGRGAEARIPDDWQATALKRPGTTASASVSTPVDGSPSAPVSGAAAASPATPAAAMQAGGNIAELLAAIGLDPTRVEPAIQQQLGTILRLAVEGLVQALKTRAQVKNTFRMPMTNIKPVENNPLKFSMNAQDAVYNLFVKRNPGYLGAVEAFEEGFQDIEFHQTAVLAGIRAAFNAMLGKFHPDHLEEQYERKVKRTAMLGLGGRSKYWELYRGQFEEIDRDREAHFQLLFGEEFAQAYNEHLQKLAADARLRRRRDS